MSTMASQSGPWPCLPLGSRLVVYLFLLASHNNTMASKWTTLEPDSGQWTALEPDSGKWTALEPELLPRELPCSQLSARCSASIKGAFEPGVWVLSRHELQLSTSSQKGPCEKGKAVPASFNRIGRCQARHHRAWYCYRRDNCRRTEAYYRLLW